MNKLFTAGEIAKISGVSSRTIRYYDIKGLLKPSNYSESGYRYYEESSLEKLQKILMLKFLGFTLVQIAEVINNDEKSKEFTAYSELKQSLNMQKNMLIEKKEHLERLIKAVDNAESSEPQDIWNNLIQVIRLTTMDEKIIEQYRSDDNLQRRINIHSYNTSDNPWFNWLYDNMKISAGMKILEAGCGNGLFWTTNAENLPENLTVYLTDYSEGMIEKAKENLAMYQSRFIERNIKFIYKKEDANNFQLDEKDFDMIIANHMLYHVTEKESFLQNIKARLSMQGRFLCSTVGDTHMRELHELVKEFSPDIEIPFQWISSSFQLENGEELLKNDFTHVKRLDYDSDLIVDNAQAIYDYVYSYPGNAATILDATGDAFLKKIELKIEREGAIYIHKSTGMFECLI